MSEPSKKSPSLQPRWFIRSFWVGQRAVYSVTGGRFGLRTARADRWGLLRLRTVGHRSGKERTAILGYFEDGPDLVTLAHDAYATLRSRRTQVVILEPRSDAQSRGNRSVRSVVYAVPTQEIDQGSVPAAGQPGEKRGP